MTEPMPFRSRRPAPAALALCAAALLGACGAGADTATGPTPPDGVWSLDGYGMVVDVDGGSVSTWHLTTSTCAGPTVEEGLDIERLVALPPAADGAPGGWSVDLVGASAPVVLSPTTVPERCRRPDPSIAATRRAVTELFTTHYPPGRNDLLVAALADFDATLDAGDDVDLAVAALADRLQDPHTGPEDHEHTAALAQLGPDAEQRLDAELEATVDRLQDRRSDPAGIAAWGRVDGTIGVLVPLGFLGRTEGDDPIADRREYRRIITSALDDLADTEALIVDLRFNPGGMDDIALDTAGHFVTEPTAAFRKWAHAAPEPHTVVVEPATPAYRGPVALLTSPVTNSAAEVFALAMTGMLDVTVVGRRSVGALSDMIGWVLPDGTELTLSMETYAALDGHRPEGTGIPVDIPAELERGLDVAVQALTGTSTGLHPGENRPGMRTGHTAHLQAEVDTNTPRTGTRP